METPPRLTPFIGIEFISLKEFLPVPYGPREQPVVAVPAGEEDALASGMEHPTALEYRALGSGRRGPYGPPPPTPPYVRFRIRRFKTASDDVDVAGRDSQVRAE